MARPRLLDLFCGAGGCAVGYHRAGFEVVGVDIEPQPNYPFEFIQMDALDAVQCLLERGLNAPAGFRGFGYWLLGDFTAVHASPPCQAFSDLQKQNKRVYPDYIRMTRRALRAMDLPYVIENVEGAPLVDPVMLCGASMPGLSVVRHRLFESNIPLIGVPCPEKHPLVFTYDNRKAHFGKLDQNTSYVQVTGGGNCTVANKRRAMGIDWMIGRELNEAIPPAYTEHIGHYLLKAIELGVAPMSRPLRKRLR